MIMKRAMFAFLTRLLLVIRSRFARRARLEAENLILRQQLVVLRRKSPARVRLWNIDRLLFAWLYRLYPSLLDAIIIVRPETVIRWHGAVSARTGAGSPAKAAADHGLFARFAR
jgi:hypothetical protein